MFLLSVDLTIRRLHCCFVLISWKFLSKNEFKPVLIIQNSDHVWPERVRDAVQHHKKVCFQKWFTLNEIKFNPPPTHQKTGGWAVRVQLNSHPSGCVYSLLGARRLRCRPVCAVVGRGCVCGGGLTAEVRRLDCGTEVRASVLYCMILLSVSQFNREAFGEWQWGCRRGKGGGDTCTHARAHTHTRAHTRF